MSWDVNLPVIALSRKHDVPEHPANECYCAGINMDNGILKHLTWKGEERSTRHEQDDEGGQVQRQKIINRVRLSS